jgi:hypothetical protein
MLALSRFPFLVRVAVTLILGLMLAGAGAAHRPVERPTETAALAAFVAAGGSLSDLCHDASLTGHEGGHLQGECPACVLQKCGMALAQPLVLAQVALGRFQTIWPVTHGQPVAYDPLFLPPARGPPGTTFS